MPRIVDYWLAGVKPKDIPGISPHASMTYARYSIELANRIAVWNLPLYGGDPPCKPVPELTKRRAK